MANQADPATVEGTASGSANSHGQAPATQGVMPGDDAPVAPDAGQGTVAAPASVSQLGPYPPFHGRRVSWIAVSIVMAGFLIGGLGLVFGPTWWLFWTGCGVAVLGMLMTFVTNTFEDWY